MMMARETKKTQAKGQLSLTEFIFVSVVLFGLLAASIAFWNTANDRLKESLDRRNIEVAALGVSDQLVKSEGVPDNWYTDFNGATSVGLIGQERKLDQTKINAFVSADYKEMKRRLGIGGYEMRVRISSLDGVVKFEEGSAPADPRIAVNIKRVALLNNEMVHVDVTLWA